MRDWSPPIDRRELIPFGHRLLAWWRATRWREHSDVGHLREEAAASWVTAWAASAAGVGETAALPLVLEFLADDWCEDPSMRSTLAHAATVLAGDDPAARRSLHHLVDANDMLLDSALAGWLDPRDATERALLQRILDRGGSHVAPKARERLATVAPPAWWEGRFSEDPFAGLTEAEVEAATPLVRRYVELLDVPRLHRPEGSEAQIWAAIGALPRRAAFAAARSRARSQEFLSFRDTGPMVEALVHFEGVFPLLVELRRTQGYRGSASALLEVMRALIERRDTLPVTLRHEAVAYLLPLFEDTGPPPSEVWDERCVLARTLSGLWPDDLDPKPWLDLHLRWAEEDADDPYTDGGDGPLARLSPDLAWPRALFDEALAADFGGRFAMIDRGLRNLAGGWPAEERRRLALRALDAGTERGRSWAVEMLDEIDPEALVPFLDDPRHRLPLIRHELWSSLLLRARLDLRAGKLDPEESRNVVGRLDRVWGGVANWMDAPSHRRYLRRSHPDDDASDEVDLPGDGDYERRLKRTRRYVRAHGGDALVGPPTEEEWQELRRLRAGVTDGDELVRYALVLPEGPWTHDDLAVWEAAIEATIAEGAGLGSHLCNVAEVKGAADAVRGLTRFATSGHPDADEARELLDALERGGRDPEGTSPDHHHDDEDDGW